MKKTPRKTSGKLASPPRGARFVWRKLSPAKWEDVWQERLGWLSQRLVMIVLNGYRTLRLEAHQLTRAEATQLTREFGGAVRPARPLTTRELQPQPRPPLRIRGKLIVVDSPQERKKFIRAGVPCLAIPASLAFGTGEHATTATCLRLLADVANRLRGQTWDALDLGTGSGILALAARSLGARRVDAGDFDPTAIRVAKNNAALNDTNGIVFKRLDVLRWHPARRWPVVTANVYGPILIEAAPQIAAAVEPGGWLILSGILREQTPEVTAAVRQQRLRFERITARGKWVTCLAQRGLK